MNARILSGIILASCIAMLNTSCNQGAKKEDETKMPDTTTVVKTETTPAPAPAPVQETVPDAVTASPGQNKLIKDTLGIKLVETTLKPGETSVLHSHPDYAVYIISGGKGEFTDKDGKKTVTDMKTGAVNIKAAEVHAVKNIGSTTIKVLVVDVNRPSTVVPPNPSLDATKAASAFYKVKKDSLGIRIIEGSYKPGQSSPMHSHPDLVLYVVSGGTSEFTDQAGKKMTNVVKTGQSGISPADTHSVKNTGKTALKVILFEVNRPR